MWTKDGLKGELRVDFGDHLLHNKPAKQGEGHAAGRNGEIKLVNDVPYAKELRY